MLSNSRSAVPSTSIRCVCLTPRRQTSWSNRFLRVCGSVFIVHIKLLFVSFFYEIVELSFTSKHSSARQKQTNAQRAYEISVCRMDACICMSFISLCPFSIIYIWTKFHLLQSLFAMQIIYMNQLSNYKIIFPSSMCGHSFVLWRWFLYNIKLHLLLGIDTDTLTSHYFGLLGLD